MTLKRRVVALLVVQMVAGVAAAQNAPTATEFDRVSGGQIELVTKGPRKLSGSLGLSMSETSLSSSNRGKRYEASLGGTILQDRLWFFGAASTLPQMQMPITESGALDAKLTAQIGDRNHLIAAFSENRGTNPSLSTIANPASSSFLSLHYTGTATSNLFFSASFLRRAD